MMVTSPLAGPAGAAVGPVSCSSETGLNLQLLYSLCSSMPLSSIAVGLRNCVFTFSSVSPDSYPLRPNLRATPAKLPGVSGNLGLLSENEQKVVFKKWGPGAMSAWVQILIIALGGYDCGTWLKLHLSSLICKVGMILAPVVRLWKQRLVHCKPSVSGVITYS